MIMYGIRLGNTVVDPMTGLTGIANAFSKGMHGVWMCSIQPKGDGKTMHDAWQIDANLLDKVDDGISDRLPEIQDLDALPIQLGMKVRDTVTGAIGVATRMVISMNACIYFTVELPVLKDGKIPDPLHLDYKRFEPVLPKPVAKEESATDRKVGGPMMKSMRMG